jgi:hypothetical protein
MKIFKNTFAVCLIFSLVSCKKDDNQIKVSLVGFLKSKTIVNKTNTYKTEYNYDANGKIASIIDEFEESKYVFNYSVSNKLEVNETNSKSNVFKANLAAYLLVNGKPDSIFQYNDSQDFITQKFVYNSSNQLIQIKNYGYDKSINEYYLKVPTNFLYDFKGNIISKKTVSTDSIIFSSITNTFNNVASSLEIMNPNLPERLINLDINRNINYFINYSYTFDTNNKVATETRTQTKPNNSFFNIEQVSYSYY